MQITILKETKNNEHRVALIPADVLKLISEGHTVYVESNAGSLAGFSNLEYEKVGAKIVDTQTALNQNFIVKVKEPEISHLKDNQIIMAYLHIEKNQNPKLLQTLLEKNITSYAFEEIRDHRTHRMISLGFEAGVVGMFEGLRQYGKIQEELNNKNPFKDILPIREYPTKTDAYLALREIFPRYFNAKVAIAGYGKVSKGAQEVLAQLSSPPIVLKEEDTHRTSFYGKEHAYIKEHLSKIDIFVNAIVWSPGQNRVLTVKDLEYMKDKSLIIDISCDQNGGIETCIPTTFDNPIYEHKTKNGKTIYHFCVDNLPSAMANESSVNLSRMILPYVQMVANNNILLSGLMTKDGKFVYTKQT